MLLSVVQYTPQYMATDVNLEAMADIISSTKTDVIVFPELSTSGYFMQTTDEVRSVALHRSDPRLTSLVNRAAVQKKVVVFGFPENNGLDRFFNSALVGGLGIPEYVYRKTHLFYKEQLIFTPGDSGFQVVQIPQHDCNLGIMICYDWRFPESTRTLALRGADVVAAPSNLVTEVWPMVMPARALENKVFLAVANREGTETNNAESVHFNGCSTIYSYNGRALATVEANAGTGTHVLTVEINPADTRNKSFNEFNNVFHDRRPEMYE